MRNLALLLIFFLLACTSVQKSNISNKLAHGLPKPPFVEDALIGEPIDVHSIEQIFGLTKKQAKDFSKKFKSYKYRNISPSRRVYKYLYKHLNNFNFHSDTMTATEVLSQDLGNCLSLAILTKSLANLTSIQVAYELVETPSVYQKEGGILLSSQHLRTVLYDTEVEKTGALTLFQEKVVIDYFPSSGTRTLRSVKEDEFYSMFYSNKGAEALIKNELQLAFWYLKQALFLKPDSSRAINIMGVVHVRLGFLKNAEKLYLYGLKYGKDRMELFSNYHDLLIKLKRFQEAKTIAKELEMYEDPNPFKWVKIADAAYNAKDYSAAIRYYKKAAKMADYLHEPQAGIARSQYLLGNIRLARNAIKKALKNSHKQEIKSLYQIKYEFFLKQLEKK